MQRKKLPEGSQAPRLRSSIEGRQRWEVRGIFRRPDRARALENALLSTPGVLAVRANPVSGRLLVQFSPDEIQVAPLVRGLVQKLDTLEAPPADQGLSDLTRVLAIAVPDRKQAAGPMALSALSQSVHLLQGLSFVGTVNAATGEGPAFLRTLGITRPTQRVLTMTGLTLLLTGADLLLQRRRRRAWQKLAHEAEHRLRVRLFDHLQSQDLEYFDEKGTGALIDLALRDTAQIREYIDRAADESVEKVLTLGVAAVALTRASPTLALLACLPIPFVLLAGRRFGQSVRTAFGRQGEASGRFTQTLEESLGGIADIKSFTAEEQELSRVIENSQLWSDASRAAGEATSTQLHVSRGIFTFGFALLTGVGGLMATRDDISKAAHTRSIYWFPQLTAGATGLLELNRLRQEANDAAGRLAAAFATRPEIVGGSRRLTTEEIRGEVAFDGISFGYDSAKPVLDDISFRLEPGETLAIVGPTGSGKSTLLRLLLRFYDPDQGQILLDGVDIRELDLQDLRAAVGLVRQEVYLFPGTVEDNVRYGRTHGSDPSPLGREATDLLSTLPGGLEAQVGERGQRLSGGERQRVAIVRALVKDAPILALDEATSQLDYETESAVQKAVRQTRSDRSMIVVAHRLATIRHADQILVLERGRIRERGKHEDLLELDGLYASLWRLQSGDGGGELLEVRVGQWGEN